MNKRKSLLLLTLSIFLTITTSCSKPAPKKPSAPPENPEIVAKRAEYKRIKTEMDGCYWEANQYNEKSRAKWCRDFGIGSTDADCKLPPNITARLKEELKKQGDVCWKLYGHKYQTTKKELEELQGKPVDES